jgi:hypothetical protein
MYLENIFRASALVCAVNKRLSAYYELHSLSELQSPEGTKLAQ